jgi:hypothetical protein
MLRRSRARCQPGLQAVQPSALRAVQVVGGARARPAPEDQQVGQRVAAEPVGAVHAAGHLARCEQPGQQRRAGVGVHLDPAHHVVLGGADLHRLPGDVHPSQLQELVVHRRQLAQDLPGRRVGVPAEVPPADLPVRVRSNSAPHASSSQTRSGASLPCSSAIQGLFRNFPPRMVSRKCTRQLSFGLTFPITAAQPPPAITVCALPNSDLEMIAPLAAQPRLDRRPQPGAARADHHHVAGVAIHVSHHHSPFGLVKDPWVWEGAAGHEQDVQVGQHQRAERDPGQLHVPRIQPRDPGLGPVTHRVPGEALQAAAGDVPAGVAAERVPPRQDHVDSP